MNKRKIVGLCLTLIGIIYMVLFFTFTKEFEKVNDTLCFLLTVISAVIIILGIGILLFKPQEEYFKEQEIKKEENIKLKKYYKYKPVVTYILIGMNVLVFILVNLIHGNEEVLKYAISKNILEFYKMFTSMFAHVNESHLILNMLSLYICGSKLESLIGNIKYLLVYMTSGLCSALFITIFSNNPCVGASGAIFGLFGCYLSITFKNRNVMKYTYKYDLLPTIIFNLIVTFAIPNISVIAHVGGLIVGIIYSLMFCRKIILK